MAFTYRSKRLGYDNIAAGSATGAENIIATGAGGMKGETTKLTMSQRGVSTSVLSQGLPERWMTAGSSDNNIPSATLTAGGDASSSTSPSYTSTTSDTSAFMEIVG